MKIQIPTYKIYTGKMNKVFVTEDQLQAACLQWFDRTYPHLRRTLFAVPNGGLRDMRTANILKATGVIKGPSDLILIVPYRTIYIEMKLPGKTQSPEQIDFMNKVIERSQMYVVIFYFEDFQEFVKQALQL